MNDAHVNEMQVQMWKPNTWGIIAKARGLSTTANPEERWTTQTT